MKRDAIKELINWKNKSDRMPLIIEGARQVGKTWLMQEFAKTQYKNTVYINFDSNKKIHKLFENDLNPKRIIDELELESGVKIEAENTLIIFDEIQECNRALISLKYFCENAPQYHIVSAGSLLGVAMHKGESFPVGKVSTIHLYPLTFSEFLNALGEERYKKAIDNKSYASIYILEDDLIMRLKQYYFVGGMPKAVLSYAEKQDFSQVRDIQNDIISNYEKDFSKHINSSSIPKVGMIWDSVPSQLAREKKQWIYKNLQEGARASQYEDAMYWLEKVGLIYKINRVENIEMPLSAYRQQAFKLYMSDVGLLSAKTGLTINNLTDSNPDFFNHFKGSLTEQYVLQELKSLSPAPQVFYWSNDRARGNAEVDFVIQDEGEIIPIEAKASVNLQSKSLKTYMTYYNPKAAIRTSLARYGRNKNLYDIPLYMLGQFREIVEIGN